MPAILFVLTSASITHRRAHCTWLPEAAHPYYILAPHATIDFASPKGPNPPVDETSVKMFESDAESVKFLADVTVKNKMASAKKLSEVNSKDMVFYVCGHGPAMDLAVDEFFQAGKIAAAVCHGPAALVGVTDAKGKSIFAGKTATGFSNAEGIQVDKVKEIPFLVEDKIVSLGGKYEKAAEPWAPHVVVDGNLITGQNPGSAGAIGHAILKALKS
ncbi:ThiJ/PfpI [Mycena galopus ATCC 62051]|nr:ThiJ/PfpI [Mycena galopus ATCC 62051]